MPEDNSTRECTLYSAFSHFLIARVPDGWLGEQTYLLVGDFQLTSFYSTTHSESLPTRTIAGYLSQKHTVYTHETMSSSLFCKTHSLVSLHLVRDLLFHKRQGLLEQAAQ